MRAYIAVAGIIALVVGFVFLVPYLWLLAYRWIGEGVYHWPALTYWQMFVVCLILGSMANSGRINSGKR